MLTKLLMVVCGMLALIHTSWWWWGVGFFFIWDRLDYWHYYHSRPWRKMHFPLMKLYALSAGMQSGFDRATGKGLNPKNAIFRMMKLVQPTWSEENITEFIAREWARCERFEDAQLIADELKRRNLNLNDARIQELVEKARPKFTPSDSGFFVRFIVAALIEQQYGKSHRAEYLLELLAGRVT